MKSIEKMFEGNTVRIFPKKDDLYWSLTDVCNVLELSNPSVVARGIKKDYLSNAYVTDRLNRKQEIMTVNEPGLYTLIFRSRKAEAEKFKDWIFEEVIPSIRKTGKYSIPEDVKAVSTKNRNCLTSEWKEHGIDKPYEYIQLTLQEHKALNINKKKSEMTKHEILLYSALESMEALKLFENQDINGYYDCKDSLHNTAKLITKPDKDRIPTVQK